MLQIILIWTGNNPDKVATSSPCFTLVYRAMTTTHGAVEHVIYRDHLVYIKAFQAVRNSPLTTFLLNFRKANAHKI